MSQRTWMARSWLLVALFSALRSQGPRPSLRIPVDAIPRQPRPVDLSCAARTRTLSPMAERRVELWREMGLMPADDCRELGVPDPDAGLSRSEILAKRYPPNFVLLGALSLIDEPYPTHPVEMDALGYPVANT